MRLSVLTQLKQATAMKRNLYYLIATILLTAWSVTGALYAQTASGNKSRLDIKPKSKTTTANNFNQTGVPFLKSPQKGKFPSEIRVNRSTTINEFYRQLLNTQSLKTPITETAIKVSNEGKNNPEEVLQNVEKLYQNDKISISNIYPNPASEVAAVDYAIAPGVGEAKLVFYNVLGAPVGEFPLDRNERKLTIRTSEYTNGLYFYQLYVDGKSLVTKKLLIRNQ
jgi:hypothetical protein